MPAKAPISVLFVCLGNICRSPMAEGVFKHTVETSNLMPSFTRIDSCGTSSYHIGSSPDTRTMSTLKRHGITTYQHAARQLHAQDFKEFDYILAMDEENRRDIERKRPSGSKAEVKLFGDFAPEGSVRDKIVQDPYYGGGEGFEINYKQLVRFSRGFIEEVLGEKTE